MLNFGTKKKGNIVMDRKCKLKKCDICKKEHDIADTFIFQEKSYCMDDLYSLIMELAENGVVHLDFSNL